MKKNLWMLGATIVALTSCTQNEVLDVPKSKLIGFEPFVGKNTRAAIQIQQNQTSDYTGSTAPADNLHQFWVFAKMNGETLFDGTETDARVYYANAPTSGFTYDNHKAWTLGKTYSFAAYSNGNYAIFNDKNSDQIVDSGEIENVRHEEISPEGIVIGSKLTFTNYTVGDLDLLAAITKTETLSSEATTVSNVPLTFQHMLSCIHIRLENGSDNLHMQIGNLTFNGIKKGTCVYQIIKDGNNNWEKSITWNTTESSTEKYTFEGTGINGNGQIYSYIAPGGVLNMRYFVIPQSNQNFKNIELTVKSYTKDGDTYTESKKEGSDETIKLSLAISDTNHQNWQPGYQYNYTGTLSGSAHWIHFTVNPTENWTPSDQNNLIE